MGIPRILDRDINAVEHILTMAKRVDALGYSMAHAPETPYSQANAGGRRIEYGTEYQSYMDNPDAWGTATYGTDSLYGECSTDDGKTPTGLTAMQTELFEEAFSRLAKQSNFISQADMRLYLHHLQEHRPNNSYVYMFSENQATAMMPSLREAPKGLDKRMFLNLMYRIHVDTQWTAQRIIEAFDANEGHYAVHPGLAVAQAPEKKKKGCALL